MNRPGIIGLVALALVAAIVALVLAFGGGEPAPAPSYGGGSDTGGPAAEGQLDAGTVRDPSLDRTVDRGAQRGGDGDFDRSALNAARSGFRGRVIDWQGNPVPGCGVRLYRVALDGVFSEGLGSLMDAPAEPTFDLTAAEVQTGTDGRFFMDGVWPRAVYVLLAGIGTDAPRHQIVERTPGPGEIVDLGDIQLANAAVLTGVVVDERREPVAGAVVRAVDLPGQLASFVPFHTFDPEGYVLVNTPEAPVQVIQMPPWVARMIEDLPIPQTVTGADGTFRLVGVAPGSNMVAATSPGLVAALDPAVRVDAGEEKDIGQLVLREGAEIWGEVVDSEDQPVPDAEVIAGPTIPIAPIPVALGADVGRTDAKGVFSGTGFPRASKALVAVRRSKDDPWVIAGPLSVDNDFRVVIPAETSIQVTLTSRVGEKIEAPRFKVVPGDRDEGGAEMMIAGFTRPVDLEGKVERPDPEEPVWVVRGLLPGRYMVLADAPGHGVAATNANLETETSTSLALELPAAVRIEVTVMDVEGNPIPGTTIYAQARSDEITEIPVECGKTDREGKRVVTEVTGTRFRFTARHPGWGYVHAEAEEGQTQVAMVFQPPGSIEGLILEGGQPPEIGKWSVAIVNRDADDGAMIDMPQLTSPDLQGRFVMNGLQPGDYGVQTLESLSALSSPGAFMTTMEGMWMKGDRPRERVTVPPAGVARVEFDMVAAEVYEGPGAQVTGTITVNGLPGKDLIVRGYAGRRLLANADAYGNFDLGRVPVGEHRLTVLRYDADGWFRGSSRRELWEGSVKVEDGKAVDLQIEVATGSVAGFVTGAEGDPGQRSIVVLRGDAKGGGDVRLQSETDSRGYFAFENVPVGESYTVEAGTFGGGESRHRGVVSGVAVEAGLRAEVDVRVVRTVSVSGRIDLAVFGDPRPRGVWMRFRRRQPDGERADDETFGRCDVDAGTFSADRLLPGTYDVEIHAWGEGRDYEEMKSQAPIVVGNRDLEGVVIVPVKAGN